MTMGCSLGGRPSKRGGAISNAWSLPLRFGVRLKRALHAKAVAAVVCAVLSSLVALAACSKHRPASLPIAGIYGRNTARLEVTAIVITDQERAARAREIYLAIAQLGERLAQDRKAAADRVTQLTSQPKLDVDQVEAAIEQIKRDQNAAFVHYIGLQMELRETLTAREFEQLGRFD